MAQDRGAAQAYGEEIQRLQREANRGTGLIRSVIPAGEVAVAGTARADVEVEITLQGQDPYVAVDRQIVPRNTAETYAAGTRHDLAVDPANLQHFAFTA